MTTVAEKCLQTEIASLSEICEKFEWNFTHVGKQEIRLSLPARDKSVFFLLVELEDYPIVPPAWNWTSPEFSPAEPVDLPKGGAFFHNNKVICAPWNRLAYKAYDSRGPHNDWELSNWRENPKNGKCNTLSAMALRVFTELNAPTFQGRTS